MNKTIIDPFVLSGLANPAPGGVPPAEPAYVSPIGVPVAQGSLTAAPDTMTSVAVAPMAGDLSLKPQV